jgi:epoxyqueuosine reductase
MATLENRLKDEARRLGFELVGIAAAEEADDFDRLRDWLDRGYAGEMTYLHRHAEARRHPRGVLPTVRSVVMLGMSYAPVAHAARVPLPTREPRVATTARIARYALGADYHQVLRGRIKELAGWLRRERPEAWGRAVVDTAPLLERGLARRAGLGWFGKNTMLIDRRQGSYFVLGALLLDIDLTPDPPHETSHCGTCTACLDACPTEAFVGPGVLDARRCISYLTIEVKGSIPTELVPGVGDWLYGCDVCQDVCPWNRKAPPGREPALRPRPELEAIDPVEVLLMPEAEFRTRFADTALMRPGPAGLRRNAAVVLGNVGGAAALAPLHRALDDPDPHVREAAAWGIERIQGRLGHGNTCPDA